MQASMPPTTTAATSRWRPTSHSSREPRQHCFCSLDAMVSTKASTGTTCRRMPWVFTYNDWSAGTEYDWMVQAAVTSAIEVQLYDCGAMQKKCHCIFILPRHLPTITSLGCMHAQGVPGR